MKYKCNNCGTVYDSEKLKTPMQAEIDKIICPACWTYLRREYYPAPLTETGRTLPVEIECKDKTCHKCKFVAGQLGQLTDAFCSHFNTELTVASGNPPKRWEDFEKPDVADYTRLPECIAACGGGK